MLADVTVHIPDFVLGVIVGALIVVVLLFAYGRWMMTEAGTSEGGGEDGD